MNVTSFYSISYYSLPNNLKMANFLASLDLIFALRMCNLTSIHQFYDLTTIQLRYQSFDNRLEDEPQV